jgi:hypothetical protein
MNDGKTFKESIREEIAKLKKMTFREKRQHIWEYYKLHFLLTGIAAFLVISFARHLMNPPKENFVYIAWFGPVIAQIQLDALNEKLEPVIPYPERQQITIESFALTENPATNQATGARFVAKMSAGEVDVILTTQPGLEEIHEILLIRPVYDLLEAFGKIDHRELTLYYINGQAVGISLANASALKAVDIDTDDLYLAVFAATQRIENIALVLRGMFG